MPKKQSRNAFWYFMSDWKMKEESKGRTFPNGFRDVQSDPGCNEAWKALTSAEKAPYQTRAKKSKYEGTKGKQTGTGESVQLIKEEEQKERDFKLNMDAHIRHTVFGAKKYNSLSSHKFLFIHMNWYYMREPDNGPVDFCPAEFAIAEFSLEHGITRVYHELIKTELHLGYTREALETSERTHKLRWDMPDSQDDWAIIYHEMMNFIEPLMINGKLPPIYTGKKIVHVLPSLLRRITGAVGKTPDIFLLYTVEALFANMLTSVSDFAESNVLSVIAETQFSKELFAYTPNIECDYHKLHDGTSQFCSLSVVRQWGFTFCDQCCRPLSIEMKPGIHCPDDIKMVPFNKALNNSMHSMASERTISVLSATGVSEQHRISVSERNRHDEARRRAATSTIEIIDHSQFTDKKPLPEPEPIAVASAGHTKAPFVRGPTTASQALVGMSRVAPLFNGENFPAIGGRGMRIKGAEPPRAGVPLWSHRGRKNSDSD